MTQLEKNSKSFVIANRSKYQIEKFVIGQHPTPEMQYRQILIEAQELIYKIEKAKISMKKTQIEIDRLKASTDELDQLEAQEKQLELNYTSNLFASAQKELDVLESIYKEFPQFTEEDIENNQPEYWEKRLTKQAKNDVNALKTGISAGNLDSMLSAGLIEIQEIEQ